MSADDMDFETPLPEEIVLAPPPPPPVVVTEPVKPSKKDDDFFKLDKEMINVIFVILSSLLSHNDIISNLLRVTINSESVSFIIQSILCGVIFYTICNFYKRI